MQHFQIDDENRLFVLPHDEFKQSETLKIESLEFVKKSLKFEDLIKMLVDQLKKLSLVVETDKLKALGEKSKLENAEETKRKKCKELIKIINDKKIELENLQKEHQSLQKVAQEQKLLIHKLSNNKMF